MRFDIVVYALSAAASIGLLAPVARAQPGADFDPSIQGELHPLPSSESGPGQPRTEVARTDGRTATTGDDVFVGAVTIAGLRHFSPSDFADIVAERIGRASSPADLASLADEIATRMHERGHAFAWAEVEPQRLANGILVVRVNEGRIDELRFDGAVPASVRRALAPLVTGEAVSSAELERRLLLAGDIDGIQIESSRFVREGDRGILLVRVTRDRAGMRVALNNAGTRPVGPVQARIEVDLNGVVASDDSLTLSYSTTPAQPRELQFGHIRYERRLNADGTELVLMGSASRTHPGSYLDPLNIENRSLYASAGLLQPLLRRRKASLWLTGELGVRSLVQWRDDRRVRDDQLAVARLTLYGYSDVAGGRLRASGTVSQGLGILGATEAGDPLASRSDADGTFTALSLWTDWTADLGRNFSVRLAGQGQLASQALLISEETSLGGTAFLRGYDWGERSGDEGVMASMELRYLLQKPVGAGTQAQVYAFVDGGTVSNRDGGFGDGSLASAGGGVRMDITSRLGASFEVAAPLSGPRYDTGDSTPKVNLVLIRSF